VECEHCTHFSVEPLGRRLLVIMCEHGLGARRRDAPTQFEGEPVSPAAVDAELRVAVLGAGTMGLDHIERISGAVARARVSVVVDPDDGRRADALRAAGEGAVGYRDLDAALAAGGFDAVLIASPAAFHDAPLAAVLRARLPTLCEKPLTIGSAAAQRVVDAESALARPLLQVGFHRRFDAGYRALRAAIRSGEHGQVLAMHCRHRNPRAPAGWGDDLLIEDAAAHEIDIVAWLVGEPVVSIEVLRGRRNRLGPAGLHDPLLVLLRTAGDVLVDVEINMNFQAAYQVLTEVVLERGAISAGESAVLTTTVDGARRQGEHKSYGTRFADAYDREVQAWVDSVLDGTPVAGATAWDGLRATALTEAGVESLRTGRRVEVPELATPAFYRAADA
jgi:myo-inositol 2-dehydrogenase/D-chiro-inositol 1-dehydrogenase